MYSDDEEAEVALLVKKLYSVRVPAHVNPREPATRQSHVPTAKQRQPVITATGYDPAKRRLYYGLDNGDTCFWNLTQDGCGTARYVGSHKGPVTAICIPSKDEGVLGKAGLILTGSVDSNIKIWDYQGRVMLDPTVLVQTLYGHGGTVTGLFVYGSNILSCSTDRSIRVWRAVEGRGQLVYPWFDLQATVATLDGWVRSMSYDKSDEVGDTGTFYAVDDEGGVVRIVPEEVYDEESGKRGAKSQVFTVDGNMGLAPTGSHALHMMMRSTHDRGVLLIRYIAPWRMLLTLSYDNCLRGFDAVTGELKHQWENENRCHFTSIEVDLEFDEVLAVDKQGNLAIHSVKTGHLMATKHLTDAPIVSIRGVLGRQQYAVCTEKDVTLWCVEHDLDYNVLRGGHEKAVISLYSCSGGSGATVGDADYRIFSASQDNTMRLWDPYDMACVRVLSEMKSEVSAMTFYEAWNILVTGHDNGDIRLWELDTGSHQTLRQHANSVTCLVMALIRRNEELLISGSFDGMVILWDIRSLRNEPPYMVAKFPTFGFEPPHAVPRQSSRRMSAACQLLQSTSLQARAPAPKPADDATAVTADGSDIMAVVEPPTGRKPTAPGGVDSANLGPASDVEVLCVIYDPNKKVIITGGNDHVIKVWSINGYMYKGQHVGHGNAVTCLALDSNFLFSGSDDCTIRIWDTVPAPSKDGDRALDIKGFTTAGLKTLEGHTRSVTGLEVIPSSGHLVTCSLDGLLLFWDYVAGTILHKYEHHEEFRCLALRFDRNEVLVGTLQANILRYAAGEPVNSANRGCAGPSVD